MKKCKYCGTEREDSVQFCPNCGASAIVTEEERANALKEAQEEQRLRNAEKSKMKPRTKIMLALCAVVVIIIIVIVMVVSAISAENNRVVADGKTNNQISQEYDEVKNLYANEKYEEALALIDEIPLEYKDYDDVQNTKNEIIDSYSTATISKVDQYVDNEQYSDALSLLTVVLEKTDNHQPLKTKYDEVLSGCKTSYLEKAQSLADKGEYTQAISTLETISSVITSDADIDAKILEYKKAIINNKLSEYEKSEDYASAITYLEEQLSDVSNDVDLTAKLNSYKDTYKENVFEKAENEYKTKGYEEAVLVLSEALKIFPNDETINEKINNYNSKAPVPLISLEQYSGFGLDEHDDSFKDVLGKTYIGGYLTGDTWKDTSTVYFLNNQYKQMTGKIVISSSYPYDQIVSFYDDDTNKLLGTYTITPKSVEGKEIDINLSNVKFLKIEFNDVSHRLAIVDALLFKID